MCKLTIETLLQIRDDLTVTYVVKNTSSKKKLKAYLEENPVVDPFHRIFIDPRIKSNLKGKEIGYRIEALTIVKKDKNGRVI